MKFEELPVWARKEVVKDIQAVFPEMLDPRCLKSYLDDKDDFELINIAEDEDEPEWQVQW